MAYWKCKSDVYKYLVYVYLILFPGSRFLSGAVVARQITTIAVSQTLLMNNLQAEGLTTKKYLLNTELAKSGISSTFVAYVGLIVCN